MTAEANLELEAFLKKFDSFLIACSEFEESGKWDIEKMGLMSAYFEADLTGVVLQTMSVDGSFDQAEADVYNRMFSTGCTPDELRETYRLLEPVVDDYCDAEAPDAIATLSELDPGLCESYRDLILRACAVVSSSDGIAEGKEIELIEKLKAALA